MGYEPKWKIDPLMMDTVRDYLMAYAKSKEWTWEDDGLFSTKFFTGGVLV